ncbi:hypothetical protein T12_10028 [Trichinella patagoniensis]|uniref:Uncharacterized protein n=1 Tax=Trichinella patagoniensis TaxID=990121 RepID=A0A0V0ZWY9_9BILA|nr:hypothetical protein T12_10028 [Trichinella patagoniensis]
MDRSAPAILTTDNKIDCQCERTYTTTSMRHELSQQTLSSARQTRRTSSFSNYHLQKSPATEGDMKQFDCNKKDIFSKICFTSVFYLLISVQHLSIHTDQ